MENKKEIRKKILDLRNSMPKEEQLQKSDIIIKRLLENKKFIEAENILLYINYGSEVITKKLFSYCLQNNKATACPKVISDDEMCFYRVFGKNDLKKGYKGILEPVNCQAFEPQKAVVIVPGVVFDRNNYRIGYGKGFYDRYLKKHPFYETIALAYDCQIIDNIPIEEHDEKMLQIITESC